MNEEIEIWKDVVGFDNLYMISSLGRLVCLKEDSFKWQREQRDKRKAEYKKERAEYL